MRRLVSLFSILFVLVGIGALTILTPVAAQQIDLNELYKQFKEHRQAGRYAEAGSEPPSKQSKFVKGVSDQTQSTATPPQQLAHRVPGSGQVRRGGGALASARWRSARRSSARTTWTWRRPSTDVGRPQGCQGARQTARNPRLSEARRHAAIVKKERADRYSANVLPVIREIQRSGIISFRGVARALAARGVPTARGGAWTTVQVSAILERAR